jgi:hypothetical protein
MPTTSLVNFLFRFANLKWTLLFLTLALSFHAVSQNNIQGDLGINYPVTVDGSDNVLYEYWKIGINADVTAHIKILEPLSFRPGISYQYLIFHKYVQYLSFGPGAISSTGTGSHTVKIGGELHFGDLNERDTRFSIFLGGGYAIERPGRMTIIWADDPWFQGNLPNRRYWYGSAGINLEIPITSELSIGSSVKYFRNKATSTFPDAADDIIWMVNCSILYDIMQF